VDPSLNTLAGLNTQSWRPNAFGGSGAAVNTEYTSTSYKSFRAENGADGERQFKSGRYGQHTIVRLPPGTVIQEQITRKDGSTVYKDLGSLTVEEPQMIVAQGGEGGEGSGILAKSRGVKRKRISPQGGEKKTIKLTLKIVADVALVGVPNAGTWQAIGSRQKYRPLVT
jgi:GTP-binding protein